MDFSGKWWSNGRDSTWQYLWKSSAMVTRGAWFDSRMDTIWRTSWNTDSSQGIASGPWLANPYSSSAWSRRDRKTGWLRYDARTMNLLHLLPTQIATWPAGTSGGTLMILFDSEHGENEEHAAFLRHRRSI